MSAANLVTSLRALLVAVVASFALRPMSTRAIEIAIVVAAIATALDGVDGWVARRTGTATAFGARFDMEVDALLILILSILVWRYGKAGAWVTLSGLLRYLFIAAGWILPWMRAPLRSTLRGKAICVIQIGGLLVALLPAVPPPVSTAISVVALVMLCFSFSVDTLWLYRCSG